MKKIKNNKQKKLIIKLRFLKLLNTNMAYLLLFFYYLIHHNRRIRIHNSIIIFSHSFLNSNESNS